MQCIVLIGGVGSRMRHITGETPKALLPIQDRPFLKHLLDHLINQGISHVILSVGYQSHMIFDFIDSNEFNAKIDIVDEGEELKGTAGALKEIYSKNILHDSFFVTYGDSFLPIDFKSVYESYDREHNLGLMTVYKNSNQYDKSNVIFKDGKLELYDKFYQVKSAEHFDHIDYGLSILCKKVIEEYIPSNEKYDLANVFRDLSMQKRLQGYPVKQRFFEVGSPSGLEAFKQYVEQGNIA